MEKWKKRGCKDIEPMLVIGHVGQMMHVADLNHYLRNNAFNIRGRLAQLCRARLNEVLYNLFLFMAIISNFSDYNFVGAFSQKLLTKKIQQAQVINTNQITLLLIAQYSLRIILWRGANSYQDTRITWTQQLSQVNDALLTRQLKLLHNIREGLD